MRASRSNAEQEQWRGYLDPAAVVVQDLTCRRMNLKMRDLIDWVKSIRPLRDGSSEKSGAVTHLLAENKVPFSVALRVLNLPPERSVK